MPITGNIANLRVLGTSVQTVSSSTAWYIRVVNGKVLEVMIPPMRGWVAQWQSVLHVWGSPGFDPWSGLFFLFLHKGVVTCRGNILHHAAVVHRLSLSLDSQET